MLGTGFIKVKSSAFGNFLILFYENIKILLVLGNLIIRYLNFEDRKQE